jgi:hypothetical protein
MHNLMRAMRVVRRERSYLSSWRHSLMRRKRYRDGRDFPVFGRQWDH